MGMQPSSLFLRLAKVTLVFVYLVIVAGSVVRATGSGMGCPDWPKCFGHWIPPTDVSQLPANYRDYFKVQEKSIAPFNALQTWTEYGNRLVGALLGLFMFAQLFAAFRIRQGHPLLFRLALATLILTGMEGVLGAIVVHTNLKTGVITMHMFLSLVILALQAYLVFRASQAPGASPAGGMLRKLIIASLGLTTLQILLGTQVREGVDAIAGNFDQNTRGHILDNIRYGFLKDGGVSPLLIHGIFAWIVLSLNLLILFLVSRDKSFYPVVKTQVLLIAGILFAEMAAGASLSLFALPAFLQPVHLLLASLLFGVQWSLVMRVKRSAD